MLQETSLKPRGYIIINEADGKTVEHDTLQCVHCGGHWVVRRGSGFKRGWCTICGGPHCGQAHCWTCIPLEKKLDILEGRRKLDAVIVGGF